MDEILKLLDAGGNVSTIALVLIAWRFDRRLLIVETFIANLREKKNAQGNHELVI